MDYTSLEQRVIDSFYHFMPSFHGYENNECTIEEQNNLYDFMRKIFQDLYENPNLLFKTLHEDYSFPHVFSYRDGIEKNIQIMKNIHGTIDQLIFLLIEIGKQGEFQLEKVIFDQKLPKKYQSILAHENLSFDNKSIINHGKPFFHALQWFSNQKTTTIRHFKNMAFDPNYDYLTSVLLPYLEEEKGASKDVVDWLLNHGYRVIEGCDKYEKMDHCIINYIKDIDDSHDPIGFAYMGDKAHIGFSIEYRYLATHSVFCTLRIQKMDKILKDFDHLSFSIQKFIINTAKKCDSCRYCVQLDKTKTKPKANITVHFEGKEYLICPMFPGFYFSFSKITKEDAKNFIEMFQVIEKYSLE